jgi:hypothetical protein
MADVKHAAGDGQVDAFDRVAANLGQQWYDDGLGFDGEGWRWEDQPPLAQVAYLANYAGTYNVSFERFAEAAKPLLSMTAGQEFTADHDWFVTQQYHHEWRKYGHGRVERVEDMLQTLKARTDFVEETNYVDTGTGFSLALGHVSIGHSWDQLTDDQKLGQIFRCTDFAALKHPEKMAIIAREVDVTRLTPAARGWLPWELPQAGGEVRSERLDPFDRVVADLPHQWYEDGHGDGVETWEEQSAVEKIGYLAGHAAAHRVSFERFVEAAGRTLGLASGEEFTAVEVQHLLHQIRWAHGDFSDDPAGMSPHSAPKDRLAFIAAIADERDGMPTPEEWRKLQAEWTHDYGLRRLEDRGVSYEDETERTLDHTAGGGKGEGQENKREVSPADLTESTGLASQQQGQRQTQGRGIRM